MILLSLSFIAFLLSCSFLPLATETSIFAIPLSFENIFEGIKVDPDSFISERIFFNSILLSNSFILEDDFFSDGALPKIILRQTTHHQ